MSDIERYEPTDTWVPVLADVGNLATKISDTDFVPQAYRGKPAAVAATILYGRELGLGPMTALAAIDPIKGTPSLSAEAMRALIFSAGHEIRFVETTATRCVIEGRRKGQETWTPASYTMDEAKRSGDFNKNAQYRSRPQEMMVARATSRLARMIFPEVIGGFPSPEDVDYRDGEDQAEPAAPVTVVQEKPKRAPRKKAAAKAAPAVEAGPVQAPPLPGEDGYEELVSEPPPDKPPAQEDDISDAEIVEDEEPAAEPITDAQMKKLHVLIKKHGVGNRDDGLEMISNILARQVDSTKDLSKDDASAVIDTLEQFPALDGDQ